MDRGRGDRVSKTAPPPPHPRRARVAILSAFVAGAAGVAIGLPRAGDPPAASAPAPLAATRAVLPQGSVPRLAPDAITLVPGVHLLGRTYPNAAYAVETSEGLVLVDTCREADARPILEQLADLGLDARRLRAILLTHAHGDHSLGARALRERTGARVHAGRGDAEVLRAGAPREAFFSIFAMKDATHATEVDVALDDGQELHFGDALFRVIAAPGHTPGSVCYLLERAGLRILFTGDTILSLTVSHPLSGAGTYAASLAPRYRGRLDDFEATLRRLAALPVPDLVLPGHPRADGEPESPQVAAWWWERILAFGLDSLARTRERLERDGTDFLDGTPCEVLPGLHYWGDAGGAALYGWTDADGALTLVNAPGDATLPDLVRRRAAESGLASWTPAAVLLTSCAPAATGGLRAIVEASRCRVYAPADGIGAIAAALPPGTEVLPAEELFAEGATQAAVIPIAGGAAPSVAVRFRLAGKTVLLSGEIPGPVTIEPDPMAIRWAGADPLRPEEVVRALPALESPRPDVWLPLHPLQGQNANLYDGDWARAIRHTVQVLARLAR